MDILEKIGSFASETYKYTTEKTSKFAKETKTKMEINELKSQIEDLYTEIGKKIYEQHIREEKTDIEEEIQAICNQIDELTDKIEKAKEDVLNLKDKKQCPNCYSEIKKDANYCPNCGEEQEKIEEKSDEEIIKENLENIDVSQENKEEKEDVIENLQKEDSDENE